MKRIQTGDASVLPPLGTPIATPRPPADESITPNVSLLHTDRRRSPETMQLGAASLLVDNEE